MESAAGMLHMFVAFDWGDEVDLDLARRLAPSELTRLARRPRTPASIGYRPLPLRFPLPPQTVELTFLGGELADIDVKVFDFGAVAVAMRVGFRLDPKDLTRLASSLANADPVIELARQTIEPLFKTLLPSIKQPYWSNLSEEYFVFQLFPTEGSPAPQALLEGAPQWLAQLVRLEQAELSADEVHEALRLRLTYSPGDLLICDWSASVLIDLDCDETLQTIEFANMQLLEFRHLDERLNAQMDKAYQLIHSLARGRLPFWRPQTRPLRALGDIRVETTVLLERATNALKLVGDQYLARVYHLLSQRFHLDDWAQGIQRSLDVAQGTYQVLSDQAAIYRNELLELIIILLIAFEIVMALGR